VTVEVAIQKDFLVEFEALAMIVFTDFFQRIEVVL
jgi:hypothetical protein